MAYYMFLKSLNTSHEMKVALILWLDSKSEITIMGVNHCLIYYSYFQ